MATDNAEARHDGFALPGSFQDMAKAVREMIAALRDVGLLVSDTADLFDRRKARGAARNLDKLSFAPDGMRRPLARIAAGNGTHAVVEEIANLLAETATVVENSIRDIGDHRGRIREKF